MPRWMLILIIAVPAAGILGVVGWTQLRKGPEPVVVDPNQQIAALEAEIRDLKKEYLAVAKLIQQERNDQAEARGQKLADRLTKWLNDWEAVMAPQRNADGELPPEMEGYEAVPAPVLQIRQDLMRITGF